MEKIYRGLYKISGDDKLIQTAKEIIGKDLPEDFCDRIESLAETSKILDQIIQDRSKKIDECTNDALKEVDVNFYQGPFCKVILDVDTEKMIRDLFKREKEIFKSKSEPELIIVKKV